MDRARLGRYSWLVLRLCAALLGALLCLGLAEALLMLWAAGRFGAAAPAVALLLAVGSAALPLGLRLLLRRKSRGAPITLALLAVGTVCAAFSIRLLLLALA